MRITNVYQFIIMTKYFYLETTTARSFYAIRWLDIS